MPVTKYWVNFTPPPISPSKIDAKTRIMITGKRQGEHHLLAAAQELPDLQPALAQPEAHRTGPGALRRRRHDAPIICR